MKRLFVFVFAVAIVNISYSQLGAVENKNSDPEIVGKIMIANRTFMVLDVQEVDGEELYSFSFYDLEYASLNKFETFTINKKAKDELYELIKKLCSKKEKKEFDFKSVTEKDIKLLAEKGRVRFTITEGVFNHTSQYFSLKQINKLYGK